MNTILATLLLAASANMDTETSIRNAAISELALIPAEARQELNLEMTREVHLQLKRQMEEKTASALLANSDFLLAGEPTRKPAKKK